MTEGKDTNNILFLFLWLGPYLDWSLRVQFFWNIVTRTVSQDFDLRLLTPFTEVDPDFQHSFLLLGP